MKISKMYLLALAVFVGLGAGAFILKKTYTPVKKDLYKVQAAEIRNIFRAVNAEGELEAQGTSRIGPLINGTVKHIHVAEDQVVKKGDLLVTLDNGKGGNTDEMVALATLEKAQAVLAYVKSNFERQEKLHLADQLSDDEFENFSQQLHVAQAEVKRAQATYDRESYLFKQTEIRAPHDGIILEIPVKEGEAVSTISPTTVLLQLARDLGRMKVNLHIDENRVGDIKKGQTVKLKVDTYPYKTWRGVIESVGSFPAQADNSSQSRGVTYKSIVVIDDNDKMLRPGMTVHAKIKVAKAKQVLAVPGYVFQIPAPVIKQVASELDYEYKPLDQDQKRKKLKEKGAEPHKALWLVQGNVFIEKLVGIGIDDQAYFEIKSGLSSGDHVLHDVVQTDEMKALYKKFIGGGL